MPTKAQIDDYAQRIYDTARSGTPTNKGLPPDLAALVVAQAKHETGNFTSNAFTRNNNAFGYSYVPGGVWQKGAGIISDGKPVALYSSIEDSTRELIDWIYRRVKEGIFPVNLDSIVSPDQYAYYLKQAGYYGDSLANYLSGLKRWFADLGNYVRGNSGTVILVTMVTLIVLFRKRLKF